MRKLLITGNIILGIVVVLAFAKNFSAGTVDEPVKAKTVFKAPAKTTGKNVKKGPAAVKELPEQKEAVKTIVAVDIFNNVRSPLANVRGARTELTLLGTFKFGTSLGAIIRQKNNSRQFNPYLAMAMMGGGPGGNRAFGNQGGGMRGRFTNWSQVSSNRTSNVVKQYVRLGETLSNGYMLAEVSRTHAVLVRGNDKIELELQDPSKNNSTGSRTTRRLNSTQQFQQAQMMMQRQMMRTMMQMQRTMRSSSSGGSARRR